MKFDGVDEEVSLGNSEAFDFLDGVLSISAWINIDHLADFNGIVGKRNLTSDPVCYMLSLDDTSKLRWLITQSDDTEKSIVSNSPIEKGYWLNVLVVADLTDIKMYIDGVLQTATESYDGTLAEDTANLFIGRNADDRFEGYIDEVSIYTIDKSSQAVAIYNGGTPTDLTDEIGLLGWWRMGEGATWHEAPLDTWMIPDETGAGNVGTSINMEEDDRWEYVP
jgi:hypothetical protein